MSRNLLAIFNDNSGSDRRVVRKYDNYLEVYETLFHPYRGKELALLEIGVQHGGSLQLWRGYFGEAAKLFGMDIIAECKRFEDDNTRVFIGDQSDTSFLDRCAREMPALDIIIDDGSHVVTHQIASFEYLFFNKLKDDGIYVVEDCHTSYWPAYGGGLRRKGSFIEYAKRLIDDINAWHANDPKLPVSAVTRSVRSIAFYSSLVVIQKGRVASPHGLESGSVAIDLQNVFSQGKFAPFLSKLKEFAFIRNIVRRNKYLWLLARRLVK
jgi:hypothetical protein